MSNDLRIKIGDFLAGKKNTLQLTGNGQLSEAGCGLINQAATLIIVPKSEQARNSMMIGWGQTYDPKRNERLFNITNTNWSMTRACDDLRFETNKGELILVNQSWFDSKLIRIVNKHYKRMKDEMTFSGGAIVDGKPTPMRMDTPCGVWTVFIAHTVELQKPKPKMSSTIGRTFNPITGEFE